MALSATTVMTALDLGSPPGARIRTVNWKHHVLNGDWQCNATIQPQAPRGEQCVIEQLQKLSVWLSVIAIVSDSVNCRPIRQSDSTIVLTLVMAAENTHPFNASLSKTTQVSRYQKSKTSLDFTEETVSGSGISWAIWKSAPRSRQITLPAPHRSVFHRPDALPAAQPTASKQWRQKHWRQRCKQKMAYVSLVCEEILENVFIGDGRMPRNKRQKPVQRSTSVFDKLAICR